ncbi:SH3 beta-barrel fold-containing protein [Mucilaginibacter sp.]|jgi:hypothetical protein|uniref:SH3 beta-barrel fold-containing protein n=1 Tax=Mucilaginibacter sp. TaxID=1882438 RepID=UPI0035690023
MKSRLFNIAWAVRKQFSSFSEALAFAWKTVKLQIQLCLGVVTFRYKKVSDGSIRTATGTNDHGQQLKGSDRAKNYGILTYFDTEANGFRSCQIQNILF